MPPWGPIVQPCAPNMSRNTSTNLSVCLSGVFTCGLSRHDRLNPFCKGCYSLIPLCLICKEAKVNPRRWLCTLCELCCFHSGPLSGQSDDCKIAGGGGGTQASSHRVSVKRPPDPLVHIPHPHLLPASPTRPPCFTDTSSLLHPHVLPASPTLLLPASPTRPLPYFTHTPSSLLHLRSSSGGPHKHIR